MQDEQEITHAHIKDDLRGVRTMILWVIMLGVTLVGGLGGTLMVHAVNQSAVLATQNSILERVQKSEDTTQEQRDLFTTTLQNLNQRLFDLHDTMMKSDEAAKIDAASKLDRHIDREH